MRIDLQCQVPSVPLHVVFIRFTVCAVPYSWVYRHVHKVHHTHHTVHWGVTNQLSYAERVFFVLTANAMLKILGAHPLTRSVFVPVFLFLLTDSHCGFDLPVWMDKVVPFGIMAGCKGHTAHHLRHDGNYQPFFTYLDRAMGTYMPANTVAAALGRGPGAADGGDGGREEEVMGEGRLGSKPKDM